MKNKRSNKKNILLAKFALILFLLIGFASALILINQKQDNRNQAFFAGGVLLNFKENNSFAKTGPISIPVYLNTQGIDVNSLQLKIAISGKVKDPTIKLNSKIPVKKVEEKIEGNNLYISLVGQNEGESWNTYESTELLSVNFNQLQTGETFLSFDRKATVAKSEASDENILSLGNDVVVKIGEIKPIEVKQIENKTNVAQETSKVEKINQGLLVGTIISSSLAIVMTILYLLKSQRKHPSASAIS